jgi:hypothetical protein
VTDAFDREIWNCGLDTIGDNDCTSKPSASSDSGRAEELDSGKLYDLDGFRIRWEALGVGSTALELTLAS